MVKEFTPLHILMAIILLVVQQLNRTGLLFPNLFLFPFLYFFHGYLWG